MERRKFLRKSAALASIPIVSGSFVYGTPAIAQSRELVPAADDLLRISLTEAGLPVELHDMLSKLGALWADIDAGGKLSQVFATNPSAALQQAGLSGQIDVNDPVISLMAISMDADMRAKARSLDYRGFMKELRDRGVISRTRASSEARRRIQQVINRDYESFKTEFDKMMAAAPHVREAIEKNDRINALLETMDTTNAGSVLAYPFGTGRAASPPGDQFEANLVIPVVAIVVIVISVGVVFTVALAAAITTGVVAVTTVTVGGGGCGGGRDPSCPVLHGPGTTPIHQRAQLQRDTRRAAVVADMLGRGDLATEAARRDITTQVTAAADAAIELGLIKIPQGRRAEFNKRLRSLLTPLVSETDVIVWRQL